MNSFLIFSAVCIGLASAGSHHSSHNGGYPTSYSSTSQQGQLVDVPYTVEVRRTSSSSRNYEGNSNVGRSYQNQRPQVQIQRAQLVQQQTYSQPQRSQSQQLVDVPYTVEVRSVNSDSGRNSGGRNSVGRSYEQPRPQVQIQRAQLVQQQTYSQPQRSQSQQLVDVPYTVEILSVNSDSGRNSGGRSSVGRSYEQPRPQVQVQRAQIVQQQTYSQPQRVQSRQMVDVPYTVQTVQRSTGGSTFSASRPRSYSNTGNSDQLQPIPFVVPSTGISQVERVAPVSLSTGTPLVLTPGGHSGGFGGSIGTLEGNIISNLLY